MNVEEPLKNILHVNFHKQYDLTATFLRFQEHYESPEFRGKIFHLDEYKAWYITNSPKGKKSGKFTYHTDWSGFNIPSEILNPFYDGKFDPLSKLEKKFLEQFEDRRHKDLFYIIGTYGNKNKETLKHEIAHGLFYTQPEYKSSVLNILEDIPKVQRNKIKDVLANSLGYHPSVFDDETHAYILTELERLEEENVDTGKLSDVIQKLETNFQQYSNGLFTKK